MGGVAGHQCSPLNQCRRGDNQIGIVVWKALSAGIRPENRGLVEYVGSDREYDRVLAEDAKSMEPSSGLFPQITPLHFIPGNIRECELVVLAQIPAGIQ